MLLEDLLMKVSGYDKKVSSQYGHTVFQCCENVTFSKLPFAAQLTQAMQAVLYFEWSKYESLVQVCFPS